MKAEFTKRDGMTQIIVIPENNSERAALRLFCDFHKINATACIILDVKAKEGDVNG
jgi:hypothetical protein